MDTKIIQSCDLKSYPVVGIYFSAHWCPPCRNFTPQLATFYNSVKEAGKNFEIVFFSWDRSQQEFEEYFGTMPWTAINHGNSQINELAQQNSVQGIPTLLIYKNGQLVSGNARGEVTQCGGDAGNCAALVDKWSS